MDTRRVPPWIDDVELNDVSLVHVDWTQDDHVPVDGTQVWYM